MADMRDFLEIVESAGSSAKKVDRSAFVYMEPKKDMVQFAQCNTCAAFMPGKERCALFGKNDVVVANASCGLYAHGEPSDDQEPSGSTTPEAAGYVEGQVRCENCKYLDGTTCKLYDKLNKLMPYMFDLKTKVKSKGCCNAFIAK